MPQTKHLLKPKLFVKHIDGHKRLQLLTKKKGTKTLPVEKRLHCECTPKKKKKKKREEDCIVNDIFLVDVNDFVL